MKKLITAVAVLSMMIFASSAYAAEPVKILMKNQIDGKPMAISSDVSPEIKNSRTMVPLRVISENLGATVKWSDSEVVLTKSNVEVILQLNSHTVVKNGKTVPFDAKPYLKNNRIMVPLRFIAETFGCNVSYSNFAVTVETKPLVIDGVKVKALQEEQHMILGGVVNQINGNTYNEAIYNIFVENKGKKIEAPTNYSWRSNLPPGYYYKVGQYDFLDQEGNSIKRFDIYTLVQSFDEDQDPEVLIYEANENQWYMFNHKALLGILQLIDTASKNGFLMEISNTVP
ncbi:copper amine oxidase-like protein [Fontibacillus phaseoli]|uniref:Copper amine oxidase-like protein n=1 Tax=Fontibacillus phaseoli TaxID=1416533 RepID=A0A369BTN6_9BACL|nr:copper amine oxidase N-terminal domain-containing protein [Fontibacillus phaseoli]RCX23777.1 copper amine oxidase-like protein [Fontibacillus phaseoli]